jgi:hypothetical protein
MHVSVIHLFPFPCTRDSDARDSHGFICGSIRSLPARVCRLEYSTARTGKRTAFEEVVVVIAVDGGVVSTGLDSAKRRFATRPGMGEYSI